MATALDIITGALRRINAFEAGEVLDNATTTDALAVLNDLLDSWSNENLACYSNIENIVYLTAGQYSYTVGNPVSGTFVGTTTSGSPTMGVTTIPAGVAVGGTIAGAYVPTDTTVTAIGTNTITLSANATATSANASTYTYTVPGNFAIPRPLRITNLFTRFTTAGYSSIDYPCELIDVNAYTSLGLKAQPGPWPKVCYYAEQFPLGIMNLWPNPQNGAEFHIWCDVLLADFASINTTVQLPQGYVRALKLNLALELAPEYGKKVDALLVEQAKQSKGALKNLNANIQGTAVYDRAIGATRMHDAGWILHGGFR